MSLKHTQLTSPILGYTFWCLKHTPPVRLSLLSSPGRRTFCREAMEAEGQRLPDHLMNLGRTWALFTDLCFLNSASESKPASLHLLPCWKGQEHVQDGAESVGCIDRGPPSLALPSMMESHVKQQVSKSQGFWSTQDSWHCFSSLALACCSHGVAKSRTQISDQITTATWLFALWLTLTQLNFRLVLIILSPEF